jgi:hypothetical protein
MPNFKKRTTNIEFALNTDARWRAFWQAIYNGILAVSSWTAASDTGQANFSTMLRPTATNQETGYVMFDVPAETGGFPVYKVRIGFRSQGNDTSGLAMSVEVGTATNGAGTITSAKYAYTFGMVDQINAIAGSYLANMFFCGDDADLWVAMNPNTIGRSLAFSLVRTKTKATGAKNANGYSFASRAWGNNTGGSFEGQTQALISPTGAVSWSDTKMIHLTAGHGTGNSGRTFSGPLETYYYPTLEPHRLSTATTNFVSYYTADIPVPLQNQDMVMNGVTYSCMPLGEFSVGNNNLIQHWLGNINASWSVMIPFQGTTV